MIGSSVDAKKKLMIMMGVVIPILCICSSLGYFIAVINGKDKEVVGNTSGSINLTYDEEKEIVADNLVPGWSDSKNLTITNLGDTDSKYTLYWSCVENGLTRTKDLTYELRDGTGKLMNSGEVPTSPGGKILEDVFIKRRGSDIYKLKISYAKSEEDQSVDMKKTFKLVMNVVAPGLDMKFDCPPDTTGADDLIAKYSEGNTEGLIKIDQPATVQTKETTEYRYSGSNANVKNYATFNGENWRIIGVFDVDDGTGKMEKRIKIIREASLGNYSWDSTPSNINSGYGSNQWGPSGSYPGADLMQELNDTYYNSKSGTCYNSNNNVSTTCNFTTTGLKEESRKMIDDAKWYTGASTYSATASGTYTKERSNTVGTADSGQSITKTSNWVGKIAIMYPSDYGYSSSSCYNSIALSSYNASNCVNSNWLYQSLSSTYQWTLAPVESRNYYALYVNSTGYVYNNSTYNACATRPVAYLSSRVQIAGGTGASNDRYEFKL